MCLDKLSEEATLIFIFASRLIRGQLLKKKKNLLHRGTFFPVVADPFWKSFILQRSKQEVIKVVSLCKIIGVGRFRILGGGGARLRILGGQGGHIPSRHMASFRRHVPTRFLINQCQIITFLILKSDNIENSRIELKGIVLPVPSNQIKVTLL